MVLQAGVRLGSYEIISRVGSGGMGVVYKAHDPRLDRLVAIKVLPPDLTRDDVAKQRFMLEARAASALDHPNICTIHEIDETADGHLYLVMAYYEGETLKQKIERGPLAIDEALAIAEQVGQGLAKAHDNGIVHRDIKPANLMLSGDGTVKILDFGLAKLAGSEGVTQTGTTVGTVAYMSPEQARGQDVDHRSDIWSLGVVLYETLAGVPPFRGDNLLAISRAILEDDPRPLPESACCAQSVVSRALRRRREHRYQSVAQLLVDLQRLVSQRHERVSGVLGAEVPSIAVLPFVNMSADPEQEYFCDGLAEELIDALARLEGLRVVARTSAFQFKGRAHDLRRVGEQLNVKNVLEGSVRKVGNRLRINAQLINTQDGYHLWSERYDRDMEDVFAIQDEIARAVVDKLKVKLLRAREAPLVKPATGNLDAYRLYLEGHRYWNRWTHESLHSAIELLQRAAGEDPSYGRAYGLLALCHSSLSFLGHVPPRAANPKAKAAAEKALQIDDTLAEAYTALGFVSLYYEWDWVQAERHYQRAVELSPSYQWVHNWYAWYLAILGRFTDGLAELRTAQQLDPISIEIDFYIGEMLYFARRYEQASQHLERVRDLDPSYPPAPWFLGLTYLQQGRREEAVRQIESAVTLSGRDAGYLSVLGWIYGGMDRRAEAEQILNELREVGRGGYLSPWNIAVVYAGMKELDQAFAWLDKAFEDRAGWMVFLPTFPLLDSLRSDPRFQDLLGRMHFPP